MGVVEAIFALIGYGYVWSLIFDGINLLVAAVAPDE